MQKQKAFDTRLADYSIDRYRHQQHRYTLTIALFENNRKIHSFFMKICNEMCENECRNISRGNITILWSLLMFLFSV